MTTVRKTGTNHVMTYSLPAKEAVIAAYEYDRGNMNTWDYPKNHTEFHESTHVVSCGNWWAEKDGS